SDSTAAPSGLTTETSTAPRWPLGGLESGGVRQVRTPSRITTTPSAGSPSKVTLTGPGRNPEPSIRTGVETDRNPAVGVTDATVGSRMQSSNAASSGAHGSSIASGTAGGTASGNAVA